MKNAKRTLALLLALVMSLSLLAGCGDQNGNTSGGNTASDTPLVVGYAPFSSKFSPFFSETAYDQDVWLMTQLGLLTSDRTGAIIYKGIEGETIDYNGTDYTYYGPADLEVTENADGTVYYDFTLRDDLKFSDGEPLTIDDVIFSMYVLCDPTYEGNSTLYAQPIEGMEAYRSGMSARQELILAAGPDGYTANDYYTEDQYNTFWAAFNAAGVKFAQEILDYLVAAGANAETDSVAAKAANWGFTLADDATVEDFWAAIVEKYGYDLSDDGINAEKASSSISELLTAELGDRAGEFSAGVQTGESAANISGIQKTGDYSMRIVMTKVDAVAIYQLGVTIAPMHYYGDKSLYDYDNNSFGFPKGDLSSVRAKTTQPMGAGPYKFVKFENGTVYFEANESYFQGAPKTKYVNFKECISDDDKLNGVTTGTIDITLNDEIQGGEKTGTGWKLEGVMPGQAVEKTVSITNNGSAEAWLRVKLAVRVTVGGEEMPLTFGDGQSVLLFATGDRWLAQDGYYYYRDATKSGATTEQLFSSLQLNPLLPNAYQGCTVTVDVLAQAVQVKNNNVYLTADGAEFKDADGQSVAFTALSTDDTGDGAHKSSLESVFGWPED